MHQIDSQLSYHVLKEGAGHIQLQHSMSQMLIILYLLTYKYVFMQHLFRYSQ